MKKLLVGVSLLMLSVGASAVERKASRAEKNLICEAVGAYLENLGGDTGIDVPKCKRTIKAKADYVGRSMLIEVQGRIEFLHLESKWRSNCKVTYVRSPELGNVRGDIDCKSE